MAELIRINSGEPFVAPALAEVPIEENQQALSFASRLYASEFEMVIFLTGVGAGLLRRAIETRDSGEQFLDALRRVAIICRGPKPAAVLREWNVPVHVVVPEPSTWREILTATKGRRERTVAVQEYGRSNASLIEGLQRQGKIVTSVPVYRWRLPEDTGPLQQALDRLVAGEFSVSLFTTGVQIENLLEFAAACGKREQTVAALNRTFVASIGPDCTESLQACGVAAAFEPSRPKMGILVREAAQKFSEIHAKA
jgi:uroporphyrinogen-III synthase